MGAYGSSRWEELAGVWEEEGKPLGLAVLTGDARLADRTLGAAILAQERNYFLKLEKPTYPLSGCRNCL